MELFLTRRFIKKYESLPPSVRTRIREAIAEIEARPLEGKFLTGNLAGTLSWRVGPYRILYLIEGERAIVETVSHRKDAYRR